MDITVDAKDTVMLFIHQVKGAATKEMRDCTHENGSIADRRFKFGNLEIVVFEANNE